MPQTCFKNEDAGFMAQHIIHKQKLVVKVSDAGNAFGLQNQLAALLRNRLPAELERLFDRLVPPHQVLRLDALNLDLGEINERQLEPVFVHRLLEELESAIRNETENGAVRDRAVLQPADQVSAEALLVFLQTGQLPWYKQVHSLTQWENEMMDSFSGADWQLIIDRQRTASATALQRLILQFSDAFLLQFLARFAPAELQPLPQVYDDVLRLLATASTLSEVDRRLKTWRLFLQPVINGVQTVLWDEAIAVLLMENTNPEQVKKSGPSFSPATAVVQSAWHLAQERGGQDVQVFRITDQGLPAGAGLQSKTAPDDSGDELFVESSGLVLLHPFLQPFFWEVNLVSEQAFVNEGAAWRAVLLLHFLLTGETEAGEFALPLEKILCGFPLSQTLPNRFEPSLQEETSVAKLLQSVTGYWPPLKNTSAEGLRKTFLQREGKLVRTATGWRLTVAQKTVDVLFGKLPWGFSTIRLPWMPAVLHVDWN